MNELVFIGELMLVYKDEVVLLEGILVVDCCNIVYFGILVIVGYGVGIVVVIGVEIEFGEIYWFVGVVEVVVILLIVKLVWFSKFLIIVILGLVVFMFGVGLLCW